MDILLNKIWEYSTTWTNFIKAHGSLLNRKESEKIMKNTEKSHKNEVRRGAKLRG